MSGDDMTADDALTLAMWGAGLVPVGGWTDAQRAALPHEANAAVAASGGYDDVTHAQDVCGCPPPVRSVALKSFRPERTRTAEGER